MALPLFCRDFKVYQQLLVDQAESLKVPHPELAEQQTSFQLAQAISAVIAEQGEMDFSRFVQMALYQPGLGYYSAGSQKFGSKGDFVTAPELSPLFGKTFAKQFAEILEQLISEKKKQPQELAILEIGAGSGAFAVDCLLELEELGWVVTYQILEVSADLRERQKLRLLEKAPHLLQQVSWLEKLPSDFSGLIFANEVVDALPFEWQRKNKGKLEQAKVGLAGSGFEVIWQERLLAEPISNYFEAWPEGYQSQTCPQAKAWLDELLKCLKLGVIFLVDYGYSQDELYNPHRVQGTLQSYYRQHKHDNPLLLLGLQDISRSVDFTQLAIEADQQAYQLLGYNQQAMFLMGAGINQMVDRVELSDTMHNLTQGQQLRQLLMPDELGESCKVLAIANQYQQPISGFELQNKLHDL